MNRQEYLELHAQFCKDMMEITKKKNADYSSGDDPFRNFRAVGALGLSVEQGFLTRMSDKMSRLANFTIKGSFEVKDESFIDTCLDLANYSLLLAGYYISEKQAKSFIQSTSQITDTLLGLHPVNPIKSPNV